MTLNPYRNSTVSLISSFSLHLSDRNKYKIFKFFAGGLLHDDPVSFKCNQQGFPDLPEWLRFIQRHPLDDGFLYGTPTSPGKTVIEVWSFFIPASIQLETIRMAVNAKLSNLWGWKLWASSPAAILSLELLLFFSSIYKLFEEEI